MFAELRLKKCLIRRLKSQPSSQSNSASILHSQSVTHTRTRNKASLFKSNGRKIKKISERVNLFFSLSLKSQCRGNWQVYRSRLNCISRFVWKAATPFPQSPTREVEIRIVKLIANGWADNTKLCANQFICIGFLSSQQPCDVCDTITLSIL